MFKNAEHLNHKAMSEAADIVSTTDSSLYLQYLTWIKKILLLLKNPLVNDNVDGRLCSTNSRWKNRGCSILIPTCFNYEAAGYPDIWECRMRLSQSCHCTKPYHSLFKYILPPIYECYNDVVHQTDLEKLQVLGTNQYFEGLIPMGQCKVSGFFVICVLALTALIMFGLQYIKKIIYKFRRSIATKKK